MSLYGVSVVLPMSTGAPLALALGLGALTVALVRRHLILKARDDPAAAVAPRLFDAFRPRRIDVVVGAIGCIAGLAVLVPNLRLGFPTTLSVLNLDGWSRAVLLEWLDAHPLRDSVRSSYLARPLGTYSSVPPQIGVGWELLASVPRWLVGGRAYRVVDASGAVAVPVAFSGWCHLLTVVRGRLRAWQAPLLGLCLASPTFLLPLAENYITQFLALALVPYATGSAIVAGRSAGPKALVVPALGAVAIAGVYPSVALWAVPTIALGVVLGALQDRHRTPFGPRLARRLTTIGLLAAATGPLIGARAIGNLRTISSLVANAEFPSLGLVHSSAMLLGAVMPLPRALPSSAMLALALGPPLALTAGALIPRRPGSALAPVALLAGLVLGVTALLVARFTVVHPYPYGVYKAVVSGGAIFTGLVVIALVPSGARGQGLRWPALLVWGAVWVPTGWHLLELDERGLGGFRREDVELGRAVESLPAGSTLLVEGTSSDAVSAKLRMGVAYFASRGEDARIEGLGTGWSYLLEPGGRPSAPGWRPTHAWNVVASTNSGPFGDGRRVLARFGPYALSAAPPVDATPYGVGWHGPENDATGSFQWTGGEAQILVSNRTAATRRVRLAMSVTSHQVSRIVTLRSGGTATSGHVGRRPRTIGIMLTVPPHSVVPVGLRTRPGATQGAADDARRLALRVTRVTTS